MLSSVPAESIAAGKTPAAQTSSARPLTLSTAKNPQRPLVPSPNHILCSNCHGIARPHVLMTRPPLVKDDQFLLLPMQQRVKAVKLWEKHMSEIIKADPNKSLVIIEVGGDRRMDPSRAYGEKMFKALKGSRCSYIRICAQSLDAKAAAGAKDGAGQAMLQLEMSSIVALTAIDRLISDKMRKK